MLFYAPSIRVYSQLQPLRVHVVCQCFDARGKGDLVVGETTLQQAKTTWNEMKGCDAPEEATRGGSPWMKHHHGAVLSNRELPLYLQHVCSETDFWIQAPDMGMTRQLR